MPGVGSVPALFMFRIGGNAMSPRPLILDEDGYREQRSIAGR